jgi:hypothetical protein
MFKMESKFDHQKTQRGLPLRQSTVKDQVYATVCTKQ